MRTFTSKNVAFVIPPTGLYCREDRCQSLFDPKLIPTVRAPLEECEAAGAVRSAGGRAIIIDAPVQKLTTDEVVRRLSTFQPELIVITVTFGSIDADLVFLNHLRQSLPGSMLGIRGAPCYVWAEKLLQENSALDLCLSGDYELCLVDLLNCSPSPRGVTIRSNSGMLKPTPAYIKNLDELPHPDRSSLERDLYKVRFLGAPQATVRVQRGCPFPCAYCLVHTVSGASARHRSPQDIAAEIAKLQLDGFQFFYLRAETFSVNRNWALKLCHELEARCPKIQWVTTTRVECVDEELLQAMKRSGCYGISFGVDVGSELIAGKVRKPLNLKTAKHAMRLCDKVGIISLAYIMIGFIWDTEDTLAETKQFITSLRPDLVTVHFAHPYPGTEYFQAVQSELKDVQVNSNGAQAKPALDLSNLSATRLMQWGRKILWAHYLQPRVIISIIKKLLVFRFSALRIRSTPNSTRLPQILLDQR